MGYSGIAIMRGAGGQGIAKGWLEVVVIKSGHQFDTLLFTFCIESLIFLIGRSIIPDRGGDFLFYGTFDFFQLTWRPSSKGPFTRHDIETTDSHLNCVFVL